MQKRKKLGFILAFLMFSSTINSLLEYPGKVMFGLLLFFAEGNKKDYPQPLFLENEKPKQLSPDR